MAELTKPRPIPFHFGRLAQKPSQWPQRANWTASAIIQVRFKPLGTIKRADPPAKDPPGSVRVGKVLYLPPGRAEGCHEEFSMQFDPRLKFPASFWKLKNKMDFD